MPKDRISVSVLLVLTSLLTLGSATSPAQALRDKKTLIPTADTFVRSDFPDWNQGESRELWVEKWTYREALSYLKFDLAELPAGTVIEEAKLRLYTTGGGNEAPVSVCYCPNNDWTEESITYNNKPTFSENALDTVNVTSPLTWYEWNITSNVRSTFDTEDKELSLVLKVDTNAGRIFVSTENPYARPPNPDQRPQLVVLYNAPASGNNTVITTLIIITVTVAATAAVGLTYIILKGRKNRSRKTVQPNPLQKSTLVQQTSSLIEKDSTKLVLKIQKLMIT